MNLLSPSCIVTLYEFSTMVLKLYLHPQYKIELKNFKEVKIIDTYVIKVNFLSSIYKISTQSILMSKIYFNCFQRCFSMQFRYRLEFHRPAICVVHFLPLYVFDCFLHYLPFHVRFRFSYDH